jgi:hypothetical protein
MKWKSKSPSIGDTKTKIVFAWFPVLSEDEGVWIWLEDYKAIYIFECVGYNCWDEELLGWDMIKANGLYHYPC